MKKFQEKAVYAASVLFTGLLSMAAQAGNDKSDSPITGDTAKPRFKISADVREGYDDNVYTSNINRVVSGFTQADVNIFADLGNERTTFTIGIGGGATYYYSRPGDKTDESGNLTINFAHKLNERLTITFNSYNTYQAEPQFDLLVAQNRRNGQYFYTADTLAVNYQWTRRFSTITSYNLTGIFYQDAISKQLNDYVQQTFANQFRYLVNPTTTLVAEYRLGLVSYLYANNRNAITNYFLGGFDHSFSPKFSVTLRAGGQIQDQDVGGVSSSPYAEFTANYLYQRYSSIQAYLNYGFQYSNLTVGQNNEALRTGIRVNHGFTPRLSAYMGFFYEHDDYSDTISIAGTGYTQDVFDVNTGLRFVVNPKFTLEAGYTYTNLMSNNPGLPYNRNVFTLGATYNF